MKRFLIILLFFSPPLYATSTPSLILEGGYKGGYSSGLLNSYWYQQVYLKGGYRWDTFNFAVTGSRYFNYQVFNKAGDAQGLDVNRFNGEGEVFIDDSISFSAGISGWFGQNDFCRLEGLAGLVIERGKWSFTGEVSGGKAVYNFDTIKEITFHGDFYLEAARNISDSFSIDGSYSFLYTGMDGLEGIHKHLFRGGFGYMKGKNWFLFGGAALSLDSNNYSNIGLDFGGRVYILKYLKLSFSYMFSYGNSIDSSGDAMVPGPGSSTVSEPYTSHRLLFGIALKYR